MQCKTCLTDRIARVSFSVKWAQLKFFLILGRNLPYTRLEQRRWGIAVLCRRLTAARRYWRCNHLVFKKGMDSFFCVVTMPKKKIAHLPLNTRPIALCIVNYEKSVTVRKIFKNSLKLDQAECCSFFCFEMTTK